MLRALVRRDGSGRAERPIRFLLAASVLLPVLIFLVAAVISYQAQVDDSQDRLERNLNTIYEHALKVFETFDVSGRYVDEVIAKATDADIRTNEGFYHTRLKVLTDRLPELADISVIGADGTLLVSGNVFPVPHGVNLSDRDYFKVHRGNPNLDRYVSNVIVARVPKTNERQMFFTISRRRPSPNGAFTGVTAISVAPNYFTNYYAQLPQPAIAGLIREDGTFLARYPEPSRVPAQLSPDSRFMKAIRSRPEAGTVESQSSFGGDPRLLAYRRLPRYGVYVMAGLDHDDIVRRWISGMSKHLIFGIPATLAMFGLGVIALRRTRREAAAYERLREETARREQTENALRQSQRMDAIGRLTGGIAHDFNNLLTAILGNIDLALRRISNENERVHRSLVAAREASQRAATLVQRLLSFSRQHPLEVKAVDINRLVQGMSDLLRRTIGETIVVETVLAGGLWKAAIDPNQLENALLNLAVNSRDAMPDGGRLTIETANSHLDEQYVAMTDGDVTAGQYVMVAVTDTGAGMEQATIERVFEPFFTTKPVGVGTGLGLSMVYGFVKQSSGHVRIYSEIGEGTTVKLYFPRLQPHDQVPEWPTLDAGDPQPLDADGRRATILLVEDDEQVNSFATETLQECGYRVIAVGDAASALQRFEEEAGIDLLFTDIVLPGNMNGRQLSDEVRRRRPSVKVLYSTGYTRNAIIHQGRLDANVELLSKPFTSDLLARKVADILRGDAVPPK